MPCSYISPDEETCVFMALSGRTGSQERLGVGGEVCFDGCTLRGKGAGSGVMFGEHPVA